MARIETSEPGPVHDTFQFMSQFMTIPISPHPSVGLTVRSNWSSHSTDKKAAFHTNAIKSKMPTKLNLSLHKRVLFFNRETLYQGYF